MPMYALLIPSQSQQHIPSRHFLYESKQFVDHLIKVVGILPKFIGHQFRRSRDLKCYAANFTLTTQHFISVFSR